MSSPKPASGREIWAWVIGLWILGIMSTAVVVHQGWTWVTVFDTPGIAIGVAPFPTGLMVLGVHLRRARKENAQEPLAEKPKGKAPNKKLNVSVGAFLSMVFGLSFMMMLVAQLLVKPWEERICTLSETSPGTVNATYREGHLNLSFKDTYTGPFPAQVPCYVTPGLKKRGDGTLTRPSGKRLPPLPAPFIVLGVLTLAAIGLWRWQRRQQRARH